MSSEIQASNDKKQYLFKKKLQQNQRGEREKEQKQKCRDALQIRNKEL
jgi:hypothetical protein